MPSQAQVATGFRVVGDVIIRGTTREAVLYPQFVRRGERSDRAERLGENDEGFLTYIPGRDDVRQ